MIKIFINGEALDLENNASITYKSESSLFENEVDRGEYSYPFKFPLTERNRRILGNIQELSSLNEAIKYEIDWLYLNMVRPALLYIDKVWIDVNTGQGLCEGNIVGTEGLFYSYVAGKMIKEMDLGDPFEIPAYYLADFPGTPTLPSLTLFATDIAKGVITDKPFVFPNCIFTEQAEFWSANGLSSILTENFLARAYQQVNLWMIHEYVEEANRYPDYAGGTNSFLEPDGLVYGRANQMVPMFYNWWLLDKIITSLGFTISGNLYDDEDFRKTILTNNYCPNKWEAYGSTGVVVDKCTEIDPKNHCGDLLVEDYLNSLCKIFCGVFEFDVLSRSVKFNKKETYLERTDDIIELSNNEVSPVIAKEMGTGTGLSLSYDYPNDTFIGEYTGSFDKDEITGEINHYADLAGLSVPVDSLYYVRSKNGFYRQTKLNEWTFVGYNLNDYNDSPADTINIKVSTACNYDFVEDLTGDVPIYSIPVLNGNVSVQGQKFYAGTGNIDTTVFTDSKTYPCTPCILYYHGLQFTNLGAAYGVSPVWVNPYASASNYSRDETVITKLANHSLGFHATEGIVNYRYAKWIDFYKRKTKYTFNIYVDEIKLRKLTLYSKVHILGQNFILRSTKVKVPYTGIIEVEAYKL